METVAAGGDPQIRLPAWTERVGIRPARLVEDDEVGMWRLAPAAGGSALQQRRWGWSPRSTMESLGGGDATGLTRPSRRRHRGASNEEDPPPDDEVDEYCCGTRPLEETKIDPSR